jgi:hypothetical protein
MHAKSSQFEMQLRNGELPIIKREKCVCVCVYHFFQLPAHALRGKLFYLPQIASQRDFEA